MKKMLPILISSLMIISSAQAISVTEYIEKEGPISGTKINLSNQKLSSLKGLESIANPKTVTSLDLSNNNLRIVTKERLNMFPNLLRLDLSNNQLRTLPSLDLPKLKKLKVKKNKLKSLRNLNLPSLVKLKAGNNPIKTISNLDLPKLKKFKMKNNQLTRISNINMPNIKKIKVGGNASKLFIEIGVSAKKIK